MLWGRSLYENIQKFLLFQLTINVVALGTALLGPFIGIELPLTVTQMLWVNLIMDTFAALALATEPPNPEVLGRSPRQAEAFIITGAMAKQIAFLGCGFLVLMVGILEYEMRDGTINTYELSVFFAIFVFLQLWNLFNARCLASRFLRLQGSRKIQLLARLLPPFLSSSGHGAVGKQCLSYRPPGLPRLAMDYRRNLFCVVVRGNLAQSARLVSII